MEVNYDPHRHKTSSMRHSSEVDGPKTSILPEQSDFTAFQKEGERTASSNRGLYAHHRRVSQTEQAPNIYQTYSPGNKVKTDCGRRHPVRRPGGVRDGSVETDGGQHRLASDRSKMAACCTNLSGLCSDDGPSSLMPPMQYIGILNPEPRRRPGTCRRLHSCTQIQPPKSFKETLSLGALQVQQSLSHFTDLREKQAARRMYPLTENSHHDQYDVVCGFQSRDQEPMLQVHPTRWANALVGYKTLSSPDAAVNILRPIKFGQNAVITNRTITN
jgi:hypothetical protein